MVGLDPRLDDDDADTDETVRRNALVHELSRAGAERILYVADAFREGLDVPWVAQTTGIDPWFLAQIEELVPPRSGPCPTVRSRNSTAPSGSFTSATDFPMPDWRRSSRARRTRSVPRAFRSV